MKILVLIICLIASSLGWSKTRLYLESGIVENPYNRIGIPGDDGTRFDFSESLDESYLYYRLELKHYLNERHGIRALYAPLKVTGSEVYSKDINFQGVNFPAGNKLETLFQFNSYRLTYFYQLITQDKWQLQLGATAKIRDARIKLSGSGQSKDKKNTGFVPLLYVWSRYHLTDKWNLTLDLDAMAAPQGRAIDGALMAGYEICESFQANLGYRVLEGGADNDTVYSFSRFDFYFASVEYQF